MPRPSAYPRRVCRLDYLNPGGSKKDRIALTMIEDLEVELGPV